MLWSLEKRGLSPFIHMMLIENWSQHGWNIEYFKLLKRNEIEMQSNWVCGECTAYIHTERLTQWARLRISLSGIRTRLVFRRELWFDWLGEWHAFEWNWNWIQLNSRGEYRVELNWIELKWMRKKKPNWLIMNKVDEEWMNEWINESTNGRENLFSV